MMQKLNSNYFPIAPTSLVRFKTVHGDVHTGKYDFNDIGARRWFDENGCEYTSNLIDEWEDLEPVSIKEYTVKAQVEIHCKATCKEEAEVIMHNCIASWSERKFVSSINIEIQQVREKEASNCNII